MLIADPHHRCSSPILIKSYRCCFYRQTALVDLKRDSRVKQKKMQAQRVKLFLAIKCDSCGLAEKLSLLLSPLPLWGLKKMKIIKIVYPLKNLKSISAVAIIAIQQATVASVRDLQPNVL